LRFLQLLHGSVSAFSNTLRVLVSPKRAYAILIDGPNAENAGFKVHGRRYVIRWEKLVSVIQQRIRKLGAHTKLYAGFYTRTGEDLDVTPRWLARALPWWKERGFSLMTYAKNDIDWLIVDKMRDLAAEASENGYDELHLVIVSGDHFVADVVENMRLRYPKMRIRLTVYSWYDSLSNQLIETAGPPNVIALDTIKDLTPTRETARARELAPP
jgi:hypothetical protein